MTKVFLPELPKGHEFEEFISAFYQSGKFYIERNIIERDVEEILELDIIATDYNQSPPNLTLIELKSGKWGFGDLFKIKGWASYLNIQNATFIVQEERHHTDFFKDKAKSLAIDLIIISDLKNTPDIFSEFIPRDNIDQIDINLWRFSYWVERNLLKRLNHKKKSHAEMNCYSSIYKYYFEISSGIFFTENIVERLNKLYDSFSSYHYISAKCGNELIGKNYHEECKKLPKEIFIKTYYECDYTDIQISTYVEHRARLAILKSAVDLKLYQMAGETHRTESYFEFLGTKVSNFDFLPESFLNGLNELSTHVNGHVKLSQKRSFKIEPLGKIPWGIPKKIPHGIFPGKSLP